MNCCRWWWRPLDVGSPQRELAAGMDEATVEWGIGMGSRSPQRESTRRGACCCAGLVSWPHTDSGNCAAGIDHVDSGATVGNTRITTLRSCSSRSFSNLASSSFFSCSLKRISSSFSSGKNRFLPMASFEHCFWILQEFLIWGDRQQKLKWTKCRYHIKSQQDGKCMLHALSYQ